jgi:hypothetical protein
MNQLKCSQAGTCRVRGSNSKTRLLLYLSSQNGAGLCVIPDTTTLHWALPAKDHDNY